MPDGVVERMCLFGVGVIRWIIVNRGPVRICESFDGQSRMGNAIFALLFFHICSGAMGLLSGAAAMSFRKGSRRHRLAGDVFVIAMLSLGASLNEQGCKSSERWK
jgi:hypothetical protein